MMNFENVENVLPFFKVLKAPCIYVHPENCLFKIHLKAYKIKLAKYARTRKYLSSVYDIFEAWKVAGNRLKKPPKKA